MISKEVIQEIKRKIRENKDFQRLEAKRAHYIRNGQMMKAMQMSKTIEDIEQRSINYYASAYRQQKARVTDLISVMSEEDQDLISAYGDALVMLADVLETLIIETNQTLKKYHPEFAIEMFNKLSELSKESKKHVQMFDTQYQDKDYYINLYGKTADKLTDMIVNQAKSFVNKIKKHEESVNKKARGNAKVA